MLPFRQQKRWKEKYYDKYWNYPHNCTWFPQFFKIVANEPASAIKATFKLYFPRCTEGKNGDAIRRDTDLENVETGKETILLVEDDKALRKLCVEILTDLGYTVLEASDGKEAIETSNRFHGRIDLLLTDVVMPLLNGPEAAKILTAQHPDIGVIYMSGYTENAIVHHGVLEDGIIFIHKPISRKILATTVRTVLDQQKSQNRPQHISAKKQPPETK